MARKIYMNVAEGDECRIAVLEDGRLYEFFIDRPSQLKHVGNIYKGIVNNVEPGIQAAFVDIGLERNGFLHVSDVNYSYQGNNDIRELYPRTLRIKESLPEETLLHAEEERDVEQVEDYVGDGTIVHEARSGAVEAEFLEKLEEEHRGHQVSDSPLNIEPPDKEAPRAEAAPTTAPEVTVTAEVVTTSETAAPQAQPAAADKKRRRRRRKKKSGNGAPRRWRSSPLPVRSPPRRPRRNPRPRPRPKRRRPPSLRHLRPSNPGRKQPSPKRPLPRRRPRKANRPRPPANGGAARPSAAAAGSPGALRMSWAAPQAHPKPPLRPRKTERHRRPGLRRRRPAARPHVPLPPPPLPKLQNLLRRNQEVVVQVTKASQGGKGPGLSTFVSLPGRYMVLTPNSNRGGVSRKIEDGGARSDLRKMLDRLPVPEGMGVIVRTAAINRSFEDLNRDLNYLLRVWNVISERIHDAEAPALLYTDSDPAIRAVRDYFTADTSEIVIDDKTVFDRVVAFFDQLMPSFRDRVKLYESDVPLFFSIGLESQLDHIFDKKVTLKSGGYLYVEQTEALISIDVNSGKFTSAGDAEKTAYQTNMEAIPEICRQLRLRDLGGIVCCDLIDMASAKHRSDVEHALRRELRKDRARTKVAKMSPFGVIELTRQRVRPSIKNYTYVGCPTCGGFGMVRSAETMCLSLLRRMKLALLEERVVELAVQVHPHVLSHLHSEFRDDINELEDTFEKRIVFEYAKDLVLGQSRFFYVNDRGVRVLYDMDQRINSFAQGGPKAKTNVPLPPPPSGAASPAAAQAPGDAKGRRRRRGGRRQRERELERQARDQRIKQDAGKAVSFGDQLPEVKMEIVKEAPKAAAPAKPGEPAQAGEGKRRRGRRGGRKARERESARAAQPPTEAGRKAEPAAVEKPQAAPAQAATLHVTESAKPAETAKTKPRRTATRKPAKTAKPAGKETAKETAKKPGRSSGRQRTESTAKAGKAGESSKATTRKSQPKTPAKKTATKKAAAPKKTPAKKTAAAKTTTRKTPAKKKPAK
ncbi:MAG: Rne/Rng family ribonuclease [Planctomycetota bacterium]|nr:Rne/Rng family ribonuclease [Planctomycetota bacterium]